MIISLREELSWIKALGVYKDSSVLIFGDGTVGLGFAQFAKLKGASSVILVGHHKERLRLGNAVGANCTFNSKEKDYIEPIKESIGKVDFLIDTTGDQSFVAENLQLLKSEGRLALYGTPKVPSTGPEITDSRLVEIKTDEPNSHQETINYILRGEINPKNFYSYKMPLDRINEAFFNIANRKVAAKIIIEC